MGNQNTLMPRDPEHRRHIGLRAAALAVLLCTSASASADFVVGSGSTFSLGNAHIDAGCANVLVAGTVNGGSGTFGRVGNFSLTGSFSASTSGLELGGDFNDGGTFDAGAGSVSIDDGCGAQDSHLYGQTGFNDLSISSGAGKHAIFPVGVAQGVAHSLALQGTPAMPLNIASPIAGQRGIIALAAGAAQSVAYVNARDNQASIAHIAPGPAASFHSTDAGDLVNWFDLATSPGAVVPTPTLGAGHWLLLVLLIVVTSAHFAHARRD